MDKFKLLIATIKGFKGYECAAFISFLILPLLFLVRGEYLAAICLLITSTWVIAASAYRQLNDELMGMLEDKPE